MIYNKDLLRFTVPLLHYCNLSCDYCHVPNERKEYMDFEVYKKGVDFFYSTKGVYKNIVLYGGEPLLLKDRDLDNCISYAVDKKLLYPDKNIEVTVVTNFTTYRDSLLPILEKVDNLCISIDGREASHDLNRGLFATTYNNFQKIKNSQKIMKGASINKVVNKKNVTTFYDDVLYLIDEFRLPISYNQALSVEDWDQESVDILESELKRIYQYALEKKNVHMFQNFFKIPMKSCPYGTLSMSLQGKLYNCEFIANDYENNKQPVIDLVTQKLIHKEIENCRYDISTQNCSNESCLKCGTICTNFSFQSKKFLSDGGVNILKLVKRARTRHIDDFIPLLKQIYPESFTFGIQLKNLSNIFSLFNFLYTFVNHLDVKNFIIVTSFSDNKNRVITHLLNMLVNKTKLDISFRIISDTEMPNLCIDLDDCLLYFNDKYYGNISSEIDPFFLFR